jgi:transketolase
MVALMDMNALQGGAASHYGGPAAFAELMAATHGLMFHQATQEKQDWFDLFNFVNDAGHCENGLYALKANYGFAGLQLNDLKKFRSIESPLTGHGEAHLFPQGVLISNGPLGSGLPQAQGLAMADSLAGRKRMTIAALSDGGAMEGEAKEALAAIPGLARKGKMAPFVCIISDNKTKLSGRIEQDAFSMEPTFQSLEKLGWKVLRLAEGHNLQACVATLEEAFTQVKVDPSMPVIVHARTIKGKGNQKAEASATGAHGFPLKKADELAAFLNEIYEGQTVPVEFMNWAEECQLTEKQKASVSSGTSSIQIGEGPSEKIQAGISAALIRKRKEDYPIISVSSDLQGSTGLAEFQKEFPEATLDVGIAEANMISAAAGLSLGGYIPVVDTFAQFGVTKGALPITMSNLSLAPVIAVFSHTGFQDAADGASHQALSFFAQVSSIPHTEVYALSCSSEADALLGQAIDRYASQRKAGKVPPSMIFFLGRENFARRFTADSLEYKLGQAQIVFDSVKDLPAPAGSAAVQAVTIVAAGSMLSEALKAAHELKNSGTHAVVINLSCISQPDVATVASALKRTGGHLVTLEEHRLTGGMSALLSHALLLAGEKFTLRALGIGDHFGQSSYTALELYKKHGLDAAAVVKASQSFYL